jgi:hypothetical protein
MTAITTRAWITPMSANSSTELAGQQAFPHTLVSKDPFGNQYTKAGMGLTKRELFAAMAMQGMLACDKPSDLGCAERALAYADALLAALDVSKENNDGR